MKQEEEPITGLPENAFRELKPGEVYNPLMSPDKKYSEVNAWSVTWGILMAILFSAAAAYLGLKVGQVFEAAIPIAIISVEKSLDSAPKIFSPLNFLSEPIKESFQQIPCAIHRIHQRIPQFTEDNSPCIIQQIKEILPQLFAALKELRPISCLKSSDKTAEKVEQVATQGNNIRCQVNASLPKPL